MPPYHHPPQCSALNIDDRTPLIADTQAGIHYLQQARFEIRCNRKAPPIFGSKPLF